MTLKLKINDKEVNISKDDTILQAALDSGIKFPFQCRVGSCEKCLCTLVTGEVKQAKRSAHNVEHEDKILACQSKALTDLAINVELKEEESFIIDNQIIRRKASLFDYIKFSAFHIIGFISGVIFLLGGNFTIFGFISIFLLLTIGDYLSGNDLSTPDYKKPSILTFFVWLSLPILCFVIFCALWSLGETDAFMFGHWLESIFNYDFNKARNENGIFSKVSVILLSGLMVGMLGTIPAHELTHRTWDRVSMFFGRWLLSFSFDTSFSIEHVYGHHRYVSTDVDPATAPRGRSVYKHIIVSTIEGNLSAIKIERSRLESLGLRFLSLQNRYLRGQMMSLSLICLIYYSFNLIGVLYLVIIGLMGKALLEIVNYMEHYGLVRERNSLVRPHHSWNTNSKISSWTMFNLNRHSHHHAQGEVPFENLLPLEKAPEMIGGYLSTITITLIPPLWHKLMIPKLREWDREFANKEERRLASLANLNSGRSTYNW